MYLEHFGLKKNPFLLSSAADSLYYAESHRQAAARLLFGVRQPNGVTLLLGSPGTGKTTLVRSLLGLMRATPLVPSVIFAPMMETSTDVLFQTLSGFKVNVGRRSAPELFAFLQGVVDQMAAAGKEPLVIIDEAQRLTGDALDCVRLLSSLEREGRQSIRLLLVGQPELSQTLSGENMTPLRQRISIRCQLVGLQFEEVWKYIALRIAAAGGDGRMVFQPDAIDALAVYSGGIPRVINVLADHCLMAAFGEGADLVDSDIVCVVARSMELQLDETMHRQALARKFPGEFNEETWCSAVQEYQRYEAPDFIRKIAESIATTDDSALSEKRFHRTTEFASWTTSIEH